MLFRAHPKDTGNELEVLPGELEPDKENAVGRCA